MKHLKNFFIFLLLLLGLTNGTDNFDHIISGVVFLYVSCATFGLLKRLIKKYHFESKSWLYVLPILVLFLISSLHNSSELRKYLEREPIPETYRTDMDDFLKTYYLMEKGQDYYTSFKEAVEQNAFKGAVSTNLWSWRLPTIFYLWKLLPGTSGIGIYYLFLLLCLTTFYISYKTALPVVGDRWAVLSPYLLYPYLHFASRDATILQTEWWGMFLVVLGIYFISQKKYLQAVFFASLAMIIRELYILPFIFLSILTIVKKNKTWIWFVIPIVVFGLVLWRHAQVVSQHVDVSNRFYELRLSGGKDIILATLAFGSWEYFFYRLRIFLLLYVIGLVGVLKRIKLNGHQSVLMIAFLSFYMFPLAFLFIGTSIYNDYWGILYIPVLLISTPLILSTRS